MLDDIKDYLKITWDDEDDYLTSLISCGQTKLNELAGAELDFETEGLPRSLLFDYVRYAYNNATEYFEENYQHEILRLQLMIGVSLLPEDDADDQE
ncbi:MAG TPA: phage gp6-like head-tail connector protein [Thermoanaerobacterales bacterium]|nr:phage gp6-like head-tail connector protein [Thermoanaerobacterales bacterium]